jgi:hypothetical protein
MPWQSAMPIVEATDYRVFSLLKLFSLFDIVFGIAVASSPILERLRGATERPPGLNFPKRMLLFLLAHYLSLLIIIPIYKPPVHSET